MRLSQAVEEMSVRLAEVLIDAGIVDVSDTGGASESMRSAVVLFALAIVTHKRDATLD